MEKHLGQQFFRNNVSCELWRPERFQVISNKTTALHTTGSQRVLGLQGSGKKGADKN